jgi:hypothetical protein
VPSAVAPSAALHTSHCPPHAPLQHTPSAQNVLAHVAPPPGHCCPVFNLQAPVASHVLLPEQLSGSSAFITSMHAPVPAAQVMHVPEHAPPQQMPSSQTPDKHSTLLEHVAPAAAWPMHVPAPLQ